MKIAHLFANNVVHNVSNAKDQQTFAHNAQIKIKIFLFLQELALITVLLGNSLTRELEVVLIVKLLVKYVQE